MDKKLMDDTLVLLQQHMASEAEWDLQQEKDLMKDLGELLHAYNLNHSRKITVLACTTLIHMAIKKHQELLETGETLLNRGILDGDYLFGLYHRLAAGRKEWKLLMHLAVFNKRMQLAFIKGQSTPALITDLKKEIRSYLDLNCA